MPLTVAGTPQERARIQEWLRQICTGVSVDPKTGAVTAVGPRPGDRTSGCNCLSRIIGSRRTVTIRGLPGRDSNIPGTKPQRPIGKSGGGAAVLKNPDAGTVKPNGQPGTGADGRPGTDADVYVDLSGGGKGGYRHGYPMWFVLAHELTSGHASHVVVGRAARPPSREEYETIVCEHVHVDEHPGLGRRDPNQPNRKLRRGQRVPPYRRPEVEEE